MDEKDSIIVLSGGMDSVTLLYEFRANIALAVTFDYGSNHNRREIEFARMHCERLGIEHIVIPLDFMAKYFKSSLLEGAIYPDCRPAFVRAMSSAMSAGTYDGITVMAPYTNVSKTEIARHGARLGLNYAETYSCYKGGEKHCGKCGTCRERIEALHDAGIDDPTEYEE